MTSKSNISYEERGSVHPNPLAKRLFQIASTKRSNLVVSLDVTETSSLLSLAEKLGPFIAVLKTHIDIISDFSPITLSKLQSIAKTHNFLIFEDRKFIDIGSTVQKQYHGGAFKISDWAHIVNCAVLPGPSIVDALAKVAASNNSEEKEERGLLILAEMTSQGSLATGAYTASSVDIARKYPEFVLGFVATRQLSAVSTTSTAVEEEDFVVFTTGVNLDSKGDTLGQQYQTPESAVMGGADFIIAGRGIFAAKHPVDAAKNYQQAGWQAYLNRVKG